MNRFLGTPVALAASLMLGAPASGYGYESGDQALDAVVEVVGGCTLTGTPVLQFGAYSADSDAALAATALLEIVCTGYVDAELTADYGENGSSAAGRHLSHESVAEANLLYGIAPWESPDVVRTVDAQNAGWWGSGSENAYTVSAENGGIWSQPVTIYGFIPTGQDGLPAGDYRDTVNISVTVN
jgi:spore coat protein U-like protein